MHNLVSKINLGRVQNSDRIENRLYSFLQGEYILSVANSTQISLVLCSKSIYLQTESILETSIKCSLYVSSSVLWANLKILLTLFDFFADII